MPSHVCYTPCPITACPIAACPIPIHPFTPLTRRPSPYPTKTPPHPVPHQLATPQVGLLLRFTKLVSEVVVGGIKVDKHIRQLRARTPDILVATPGRCLDLMSTDAAPELAQAFATIQVGPVNRCYTRCCSI